MIKRGEIYYIENKKYNDSVGSEQQPGRPAIVVSNDKCNETSPVVEIVYLTTQPKIDLPTHIDIRSAAKPSIALCEQITSVSVDRIGDYIGVCTDYEMAMIDAALAISLALTFDQPKKEKSYTVSKAPEKKEAVVDAPQVGTNTETIIKLTVERDTYKTLYEKLLERMVGSR